MPFAFAGDLRTYYRIDGPDNRPTLMFSHSLGCDHSMWDVQTAALQHHFRILRYDIRGHGATDVTAGEYTIGMLGRDALALANVLGIGTFAFCGLSLGGMIAQWLAVNASNRLTAAILANTSARTLNVGVMEQRMQSVSTGGMSAVAEQVLRRFFTEERLRANSNGVAGVRRVLLATSPIGYAGCCAAVRDLDQLALLPKIRVPTLVIVGNDDASTPWLGHGEILAREIHQACVERFAGGHLSNIEIPYSFTSSIARFLIPEATGDPQEMRRLALVCCAVSNRWHDCPDEIRPGWIRQP